MPRLSKEAVRYLRNLLDENPSIEQEVFIDAYANVYIEDPEKLIKQDIRRKANGFVARHKGSDGVRKCVCVCDNDVHKYVNVDRTDDAKEIILADDLVQKMLLGVQKLANKTSKRRAEVAGQLTIEDLRSERLTM